MKIILRYILVLVLANSFLLANAQKGKVKTVENDYRDFSYVKTSEVLLKVAENGFKSQELLEKLANSYYFNNNMKQASRWYRELLSLTEDVDPEYYFRYALALKGIEDYEGSDKWMKKFNELKPSDSRGLAFTEKKDYISDIKSLTNEFIEIKNLDINSEYSDFGAAELNGNLVFASSRGNGEIYEWNNQPYLDLYSAYRYDNKEFSEVTSLNSKINTKYHESSAAYSQDEKLMFFTRNNYYKKRAGKDKEGTNRLQLFSAKLNEDGVWDNIRSVHFNSDDYSVAHPTINKEGNRLYFASDMEGSLGLSDIYVVDIKEDGTLGTPINLGASINTEGQESFPFINTSGDLYYATNGLPGLGGLDIFVSKELDQSIASSQKQNFVVENLGMPFNSIADDFGFYENVVNKEGYFTSNRDGGKGDDDIYSYNELECKQLVRGVVRDVNTKALIPAATVVLFDKNGGELERVIVGNDAAFSFNVDCVVDYIVRGSKETYTPDEKRFTTTKSKLELELGLDLEKEQIELKPCDDLAKALNIPLIYFDFDKYDIKYVAEIELQKVLAVLNQYPTMSIDIRSHTDCRASYAYNERLSDNRAKSTRQYLIDQGISASRITAKGYGESQLVNDCGCEPTNESSCSELEHQKNRRSEFIITSFKGETCND